MIRKTLLAAIGLVTLGTAIYSAPAEAGRLTVTNNSATVSRVKWKVDSSESGWTTLSLGQSTFRDYPDNYPHIEIIVEMNQVFGWKRICKNSKFSPARNWNFEIKGVMTISCEAK